MIWPPWKRRSGGDGRHRKGESANANESQDLSKLAREAKQANERADDVLEQAKARTPEVREVSLSLQYLHNRNQFSEMMILSLQRNKT